MFGYRITKYDPKKRNSQGYYQPDEWISIHDIGTIYEGEKFTLDEYLKVEDAYVEAIMIFINFLGLNTVTLIDYEKHKLFLPNLLTPELFNAYETSKPGEEVSKEKIPYLARLALREDIYCVFKNDDIFIRFDFDYYMFIGSSKPLPRKLIKKIESLGLFVEDISTSYLFYIDKE